MEEAKYPWIVQTRSSMGTCTGALIDSTHILSAAHCFVGSMVDENEGKRASGIITVTLGTNINLCDPMDPTRNCSPVVANVSHYTVHPTWETQDMLGADVAVLTLTSPVQYSDKVKPICLPSNPGQNYVGKVAVASGFGNDVDMVNQEHLMETNTTVISDEECAKILYETLKKDERTPDWVTEELVLDSFKTKLCTQGSPIDNNPNVTTGGRMGDSGSALNFKENGRFLILKIYLIFYTVFLLFRYAAIGVLSWQSRDTAKVKNPDNIWLEIIPEIKSWIKNIATNAQDSDCEALTTVSTPSVTTTTTTITTITTTSKYQMLKKS